MKTKTVMERRPTNPLVCPTRKVLCLTPWLLFIYSGLLQNQFLGLQLSVRYTATLIHALGKAIVWVCCFLCARGAVFFPWFGIFRCWQNLENKERRPLRENNMRQKGHGIRQVVVTKQNYFGHMYQLRSKKSVPSLVARQLATLIPNSINL